MEWYIPAIAVSFLTAMYIHTNHFFQLDGVQLVHLRAVFVFVVAAVVLPWLGALPTNPWLYAAAAGVGVLTTFADRNLLNAAAKYGGRLTSLFISIKIALVFVAWSVWDPASFTPLLKQPVTLAGLAACYGLMVIALIKMRRNDACLGALLAITPAAILLGMSDVLSKHVLDGTNMWSQTIAFLGTVSVSQWLVSAGLLRRSGTSLRGLYTWVNVQATVVIGVVFFVMVLTFLYAVVLSPNPAYVSAVSVLSTAWLTLYYKLTCGDDASLVASLVLVFAAIMLTLMTA